MGATAAFAAVALLSLTPGSGAAQPAEAGERYLPDSPDTVLAVLERDQQPANSLLTLRRELRERPDDPDLASQFAARALRQYAVSGDPRLLGYADGALRPWHDVASPPADIWLLRGRLRQTQHDFSAAATDLESLLAVHPGTVEAMLLAGDARRRAGQIPAARAHCLQLHFAGRPDLASLCAADLALTLGRADDAYASAQGVIERAQIARQANESAWAWSVYADAAVAAGHRADARAAYERAMALDKPVPLALHLAYVDLLLADSDFAAASPLLATLPEADAVLLRRAMLESMSAGGHFPAARVALQQRFEAADLAGTAALHFRERALYALHVTGDAPAALEYARRNWQTQKGWEDAELLIEAAERAGDAAAAGIVDDWRAGARGDVS